MKGRIGYLFCLTCLYNSGSHREPTLLKLHDKHLTLHPKHELQYRS